MRVGRVVGLSRVTTHSKKMESRRCFVETSYETGHDIVSIGVGRTVVLG